MTSEIPFQFDVFLCHNSKDKPEIKKIAHELQAQGLSPWLDEWELRPGLSWQELLEEQIKRIHSAGVFVGSDGIGPWQNREMRAFLSEFVDRGCPVIPVLLANAPSQPVLPIFLKAMTWVDFRCADPDPIARLVWGITGKKPTLSAKKLRLTDEEIENVVNRKSAIIATETPKPAPQKEIELRSERGIDYTKLRDLLKQHKWKEADAETATVMLQVANRTKEGSLREKDIDNFPCEDLRTIDRLWVKYSNGRFGFSVQAKIYCGLGGTRDYNKRVLDVFGDKVGWRVNNEWIYYRDVTFDLKSPQGYLPVTGVGG